MYTKLFTQNQADSNCNPCIQFDPVHGLGHHGCLQSWLRAHRLLQRHQSRLSGLHSGLDITINVAHLQRPRHFHQTKMLQDQPLSGVWQLNPLSQNLWLSSLPLFADSHHFPSGGLLLSTIDSWCIEVEFSIESPKIRLKAIIPLFAVHDSNWHHWGLDDRHPVLDGRLFAELH